MLNECKHKKLPPFGKDLLARQQANDLPTNDVFIYVGQEAWQRAKIKLHNKQSALVLPIGAKPNQFSWPVSKLSVLIFDEFGLGSLEVEFWAFVLLLNGAAVVRYLPPTLNGLRVFNRNSWRAAA